jgi:hypothetical protein
MRRDAHEVTVAAPPNVVNLERGYLQLTRFDDCPGNGRALDGSSQGLVEIGMMIPRSKEREMTRRQMTLDEVEELWDRYRVVRRWRASDSSSSGSRSHPGRLSARYSVCPWFVLWVAGWARLGSNKEPTVGRL